jgi:putative phosphoribosyl transferase
MSSFTAPIVASVAIPCQGRAGETLELPGELSLPEQPRGTVLFAHGSGSGRSSPRNRFVAEILNEAGLATLLFDLLTSQEAEDRGNVFDVDLLAERLLAGIGWVARSESTARLPLGLFGASTGAAAALVAAARSRRVSAVVSRGGRPDLANAALPRVHVPVLLIVGALDVDVLELNRRALKHLVSERQLQIVRGASHLFEEEGTLADVARLAAEWFRRYLHPIAS